MFQPRKHQKFYLQLHGICFIVTWIFFVTVGNFIGCFYKNIYKKSKICRVKTWLLVKFINNVDSFTYEELCNTNTSFIVTLYFFYFACISYGVWNIFVHSWSIWMAQSWWSQKGCDACFGRIQCHCIIHPQFDFWFLSQVFFLYQKEKNIGSPEQTSLSNIFS